MLTNAFNGHALIGQAQAYGEQVKKVTDPALIPGLLAKFPEVAKVVAPFGQDQHAAQAGLLAAVRDFMAQSFAHTYWVAAFLVALTLIPAYFLPRKSEVSHLLDDDAERAPVIMH